MPRLPAEPSYFSINLTEDDIMAGGERLAKNIPYYRAREKMKAEQNGRMTLCLDHQKIVKTPYRPGDKIAFVTVADYGYGNHPCKYTIVAVATVLSVKEAYHYVEVEEGPVKFGNILGKVKK